MTAIQSDCPHEHRWCRMGHAALLRVVTDGCCSSKPVYGNLGGIANWVCCPFSVGILRSTPQGMTCLSNSVPINGVPSSFTPPPAGPLKFYPLVIPYPENKGGKTLTVPKNTTFLLKRPRSGRTVRVLPPCFPPPGEQGRG